MQTLIAKLGKKLPVAASVRGRFVRGITWTLIGNLFLQAAKLGGGMIIARLLGQTKFGELSIINSTVTLLGILAGFGLGMTATKYVAEWRDKDQERTGEIVGLVLLLALAASSVVTISTFALLPTIARRLLNAIDLLPELRVGALLILLSGLCGVQNGVLAGMEAFRSLARLNILHGLLYICSTVLAARYFGLRGVIWASVLVGLVLLLAGQFALRVESRRADLRISYRAKSEYWPLLWQFGLPAVLVSMSSQPFSWLVRVYLVNRPNGYAELAILDVALSWSMVLLFLPRQLSGPSMAILSNLYGQKRGRDFGQVFRLNLSLTVGLAFLVALPLMALSRMIMRSYGASFASGWPTLPVLLCAYAVGAGTLVFRDAIASSGNMWWQALHSMIWGGVLLGGTMALVQYGALGVGIAYLIAFLSLFVVQGSFAVVKGIGRPVVGGDANSSTSSERAEL